VKNIIPLELSLAERLAKSQLATPFCGFCRTERAAVEELKQRLSHTGRRPTQPNPAEDGSNRHVGVDATTPSDPAADRYAELKTALSQLAVQETAVNWQTYTDEAAAMAGHLLDDLDQAQATVKEMGELIDAQAAELEQLRKLFDGRTYTHKTKGRYYQLIGPGKVAGSLKRGIGAWDLDVYRDIMTGAIYVREQGDFHQAMEPV